LIYEGREQCEDEDEKRRHDLLPSSHFISYLIILLAASCSATILTSQPSPWHVAWLVNVDSRTFITVVSVCEDLCLVATWATKIGGQLAIVVMEDHCMTYVHLSPLWLVQSARKHTRDGVRSSRVG